MPTPTRVLLLAMAVVLVGAVGHAPSLGSADDDNDNAGGSKKAPTPSAGRPDLKIEYAGYQNPANTQLIKFKITNVGAARSTAIKAIAITLQPDPTPWQRDLDVPALAPGASHEVFYPLAAPCDGHKVRASVDDPLDLASSNDRVEVEVCARKAGPASKEFSPSRIGDPGVSVVPEHLQKGEHRLELPPSVFRAHGLSRKNEGIFGCLVELTPPLADKDVGFSHQDGLGCDLNSVYQLIVDFDIQWLKDLDQKLVFRAELRYEEQSFAMRMNDEAPLGWEFFDPDTCVSRIGLAPLGYDAAINRKELLSTADAGDARLDVGWLVTRDIQFSLAPGTRFQGFVLHGFNDDRDAEDKNGCHSSILNMRLWLHYAVL